MLNVNQICMQWKYRNEQIMVCDVPLDKDEVKYLVTICNFLDIATHEYYLQDSILVRKCKYNHAHNVPWQDTVEELQKMNNSIKEVA